MEAELSDWHKIYIPSPRSRLEYGRELVGLTVLDVGAGCGETAQFYLLHGATHVVCIETDPAALHHLRQNFGLDSRVTIIPRFVNLAKIDIEGSEEWLTVETHFPTQFRKFRNPHAPDVNTYRVERRRLRLTQRIRTVGGLLHRIRIGIAHTIRGVLNRLST